MLLNLSTQHSAEVRPNVQHSFGEPAYNLQVIRPISTLYPFTTLAYMVTL